jgi:uncharacterized repeat protein (TIGR03803 family)
MSPIISLIKKISIAELLAIFFVPFTASGQELWMLLEKGGKDNVGTISHYVPSSSSFTTDFTFTAPYPGAMPLFGMVEANNKFYGTTFLGGEHNAGVIYEWDPVSKIYTKLFDFDNVNGSSHYGPLTLVGDKLYGSTEGGGEHNGGVIYEWDLSTKTFRKAFDFYPAGGMNCTVSLTYYNGKLYGATNRGSVDDRGTLFEWDPATGLYVKKIDIANVTTGRIGTAALTMYRGKFYGATSLGGINNSGGLFEWDPQTNVFTSKVDSEYINGSGFGSTLTLHNGKFYSNAYGGGIAAGVIFEWDPVTNIYTKKIDLGQTTGFYPTASPLIFVNGKGYGVTIAGGAKGRGVLYEWDPVTNLYTVKESFTPLHGADPIGGLIYKDGSLYGVTASGGAGPAGVIYEWNIASNKFIRHADFNGSIFGSNPRGTLVYMNDKFYGTTYNGGSYNEGVLFEWDPSTRVFRKKISFNHDLLGKNPQGRLVHYNGKFYGLAEFGGRYDYGTIFEWDPATNLCVKKAEFVYTNGRNPVGSLTYSGGKFYGITSRGGSDDQGVLFEWDPVTNDLTAKVHFNFFRGINPQGPLVNVNDRLYGVTKTGGDGWGGVIFRYTPASDEYTDDINFPSGYSPQALTYANDKFYGVTEFGGVNNAGIIFEWQIGSNEYTKKVDLSYVNGAFPSGAMALSNGRFYGMTRSGGANGVGVLFEWDPATNRYRKLKDFNMATGASPIYSGILEELNVALPPIYVVTPADGATGQKIKLNVLSKAVKGATTYTIQLSRVSNFSSGVLSKSGGAYIQTFDSLRYNTTYYARARTDIDARFGKVTSFKTVGPEYYSYVVWPRNNATDVKTETSISSNTVPFATFYVIQLSQRPDFSVISFEKRANERSIYFTGLKNNTKYYTRVRTNLTLLWGQVGSFTTVSGTASVRLLSGSSARSSETMVRGFEVTTYPNPFKHELGIYVESETDEPANLQLLDLRGREMCRTTQSTNTWIGMTSTGSAAVYLLRVTIGRKTKTVRVAKEE